MGKTYGETFAEANACSTVEEAQAWLKTEIQRYVTEFNQTPEEAESVIKQNLGYFAGYYDTATREKIERLFSAEHPIFGPTRFKYTPDEIFNMGVEAGKKLK